MRYHCHVTAIKKLFDRLRRLPPDMRFDEVARVLEYLGYSKIRGRGSHLVYGKPGAFPITLVKEGGRKVKRVYLKKVLDLLKEEETDEKEDRRTDE